MTGPPPEVPVISAGQVATATLLNQCSAVATFLINKPSVYVQANAAQALTTAGTPVSFATDVHDTDSTAMWVVGSPTKLTVKTPGYWRVAYGVPGTTASTTCWVRVTTGSNNPLGSGNTFACWSGASTANGGAVFCVKAAGVIPYFLYQLDYVELIAQPSSNISTDTSVLYASMSLEFVSAGY